jgi:hypothetical protein
VNGVGVVDDSPFFDEAGVSVYAAEFLEDQRQAGATVWSNDDAAPGVSDD